MICCKIQTIISISIDGMEKFNGRIKAMYVYRYYYTDEYGFEEWDIEGNNYIELMETCFKYSSKLSLIFWDNFANPLEEVLKPFEIPQIESAVTNYSGSYVKCYKTCPELLDFMLKTSDSLFKWINGWDYTNPEDPTFYRKDDSIFFASTIHEGECILMPKEDEDVFNIVCKEHWERIR